MKLIRNSFLVASLLLILHAVFLWKTGYTKFQGQHQWQENIIKGQNFLYDNSSTAPYIIVGSSLSERLLLDTSNQFINLSFGGESIYDGFEILSRKKSLPKYLFVEMNVILRSKNMDFCSSLTSDVPFFLKKHFPSLRDAYEPCSILGNKFVIPFVRWSFGKIKSKPNTASVTKVVEKDNSVFIKMLNLQIKSYNQIPADSILKNKMKTLTYWVSYFQKKNVTVVFFEMPVDSSLENLGKATAIRNAFRTYFPLAKYHYIPNAEIPQLKTTDGVHLDNPSAKIYTNFFKEEASMIRRTLNK